MKSRIKIPENSEVSKLRKYFPIAAKLPALKCGTELLHESAVKGLFSLTIERKPACILSKLRRSDRCVWGFKKVFSVISWHGLRILPFEWCCHST
jgi:hypothetical protein